MYTYPDAHDLLTMELINSEFDGVYWGESEENVFSHALCEIEKIKGERRMLDLGCGLGRLFSVFSPYTDFIQGLEPDAQRFVQATKAAEAFAGKVDVKQGDLSVLKDDIQRFHVVLMSHILQHIKEETIIGMLEALEAKTEKNALLLVTTTHTEADHDLYFREFWEDGQRQTEQIDKEKFESVFDAGAELPVRLFTEETVKRLFDRHGF